MAERDHLDPANNELPNLSTWHRVPVGATVPAGTPYAYVYKDAITVRLGGYFEDYTARRNSCYTYYTEHPIAPPLPTEEGAKILASSDCHFAPYVLLTREGDHWNTCYGTVWSVDQILAWAPVTIGETVVRQ